MDGNYNRATILKYGYYGSVRQFLQKNDIDQGQAWTLREEYSKDILKKVREGRSELRRLDEALSRMEGAAVQAQAQAGSVDYTQAENALRQAIIALDGWTISLLETDISLLGVIYNPDTAAARVINLKEQFADLFQQRIYDVNVDMLKGYKGLFPITLVGPL